MTDIRAFGRYLLRTIWRMTKPPSSKGVRRIIIMICLITGLGRLGFYGFMTATYIPAEWYGSVFIVLAGLLMLTTWRHRLAARGRIVAALTAAVLAWLAADVFPNMTSALFLVVMAWACIGEVAATHDY